MEIVKESRSRYKNRYRNNRERLFLEIREGLLKNSVKTLKFTRSTDIGPKFIKKPSRTSPKSTKIAPSTALEPKLRPERLKNGFRLSGSLGALALFEPKCRPKVILETPLGIENCPKIVLLQINGHIYRLKTPSGRDS